MSKEVARKCPACGQVKKYRSDQKSCGCQGSNPELHVNSAEFKEQIESVLAKTKKFLLGKSRTLTQLADHLDVSPKAAMSFVSTLKAKNFNVDLREDSISIGREQEPGSQLVIDVSDFLEGTWYRFGAMGDTHLASKYERLDVLNALYDIYAAEGITTVYHTGNIVDGETSFNKFDLKTRSGIGPQADYLAANYPQRDGIATRFITGDDHEGWWINREGLNVGKFLQDTAEGAGRKDLTWIGHVEADIYFKADKGQAWMRVMHPGGGSAYAISYTEQKIVESFQGGEKPHIMLLGHYHKLNSGYPREVHTVQTGCTQDQTPFMRKNKLQAMVGGWIVEFMQSPTGEITRFRTELFTFFDRKFYEKNDKYRRW